MAVQFGLCDFLYDPDTKAVIGPQWAQHTRAFGVSLVRAAITTAQDGSMPTGLLRQGLETYGAVGVAVEGEFSPAFHPVGGSTSLYPNMALNVVGDTFNSAYIEGVTLRAAAVAQQAIKSGLTSVVFWNEPNELALLKPGVVVPAGPKGGALAPEVAAALFWQAASRLKHVGITDVSCGALSVLPFTGTDAKNPYYAAWVDAFYQACAKHGRHAPFPWNGWAVNTEGVWTADKLAKALGVLRGIMTRYGDTGTIKITEWGWQNGRGVNAADAATTFAAIGASDATSATFFQGPGAVPYLGPVSQYTDYGCWQWVQNGTTLLPEGDYAWGTLLRTLYHPAPLAA